MAQADARSMLVTQGWSDTVHSPFVERWIGPYPSIAQIRYLAV